MSQIEVEQSEEYIKQLKEQTEQEQLRTDNKVTSPNQPERHTTVSSQN